MTKFEKISYHLRELAKIFDIFSTKNNLTIKQNRNGKRWTYREQIALKDKTNKGISCKEISEQHQRTIGAIIARQKLQERNSKKQKTDEN